MNDPKPEDVMYWLEQYPERKVCRDALALLREKNAEIERLTKERDEARTDCAVAEQLHYVCKKELEEMKGEK